MNMKIGILTFQRTTNFGSLLQAFSLYKAIKDLGYNCKIIDYKCNAIERREIPSDKINNLKPKTIIKHFFMDSDIKIKYENIANFLNTKASMSGRYCKENINKANDEFDCFIAGSDLIWDFNLTGNDTTYFLDFVNDNNLKIAYSTSIGKIWSGESAKIARKLINRFDHVALREEKSLRDFELATNVRADSVCDPTMLINPSYWKDLARNLHIENQFKYNRSYILIYFHNPQMLKDAKYIASKLKLHVLVINYSIPYSGVINVQPYKVEDFLWLINNANIVLTSSYHGMLFSIYFNRNFICYYRDNSHNVRFDSVIEKLGLQNQIRNNCDLDNLILIDYEMINNKVSEWRNISLSILKEYLGYDENM